MHALIKSEAYYLTHDPVIRRWENNPALRKRAENLRICLQYAGCANTRIFTLVMRETGVAVMTCGHTFMVAWDFVCENLENFLEMQDDRKQFQKYLARHAV